MAEALPPEVERLASFGKALEGTINITQDDIDEVPSDDGSPSASLEALPSDKVKLLEALKKRRTYLYRLCTRLRREAQANENVSSERWNQLTEGAMRHLVDLNTIESEIAEILKPTKRDKEKTKGYKKNLRELIATFGEFRDSQLQKEAAKRKAEQSEKEVLSDTGSDQGRGFETADEFNQRLNEAASLNPDEPDATVILPGATHRRDARVHFDDEAATEANTVDTGRQQQTETNSQTESSEGTASEDDELEILKQQLAVKNYTEKVLKEQLAIKERELAEVDLRNRQLIYKLDKEKNENLKLSGELRKKSVTSGSANPDPSARPPLPSLRDTGTIPKSTSSESNQQSEQSRSDREARKSRLQPDLNYDFRSRQGDFFTSSPAYIGLTRGAAGGGVTGGQPPDDQDPSRPFQSDTGAIRTNLLGDLSAQVDSPYPSDPLKGLTRYQMSKFGGKEAQYEYWKLQFQSSYGARNIPVKEKILFLLSLLEGEPSILCARFVRHNIDDETYNTLWEVLDQRYGGQNREDQQVMEEFDKVRILESYDLKEIQGLADCLVSVRDYYRKVDPGSLIQPRGLLAQKARKKLGQQAGIDYLKYLAEQGKEDTFLELVNFVRDRYRIAQRIEREFAKTGKRSVNYTDTYQVEASENDSFEQGSDIDCAKFNAQGKSGSKSRPPTQKKWKNQGVSSGSREASARDNQKLTLTADYQKNQNKKPFYSGTKAFNTAMCPLCRTKHAMWKCTKFLALRAKERQSVIKKFKLCFHCLGSGHRVSACRFYPKQLCGVKGCQRFHHRLLHPSTKSTVFYEDRDSDCSTLPDFDQINFDDLESGSDNSDEVPEQSETFHTDVFGVARDGAISLQTLVCDIRTKSGTKQVVVLLDSGSNSTLIDQALASKLKAEVVDGPIVRKVNYVDRQVEVKSDLVSFELVNPNNKYSRTVLAWTVENLAKRSNVVDWSVARKKFEHLRDVKFTPLPTPAKIDVLIGADCHDLMRSLEIISSKKPDHPWAVKTPLGWTCLGPSEPRFPGEVTKAEVHSMIIND